MRRWAIAGAWLFLLGCFAGCGDRLADMQGQMKGTWVLESRQLPDGTQLRPPQVRGVFEWTPIDSRSAHVTASLLVEASAQASRTFDYAASTYEISTSAITRKRHLLIRQGYRSSAEAPLTVDPKAKTAKGKISAEGASIRISHEEGFSQVYTGDTMTAQFSDAFTDTWKKVK